MTETLLLWTATVVTGSVMLVDYAVRPGPAGRSLASWASSLPVELDPRLPTLVMVAHPRCPCTVASIEQLARLMAGVQGKVRAYVLLSGPLATEDALSEGLGWQASQIPGVTVVKDADGSAAETLGIATSGHVLLFGPDGARRFSGGITAARGHIGDNLGQNAVRGAIDGDASGMPDTAPIFGCAVKGGRS